MHVDDELRLLKLKEQQIYKEEKRIEQAEKRIEREEDRIEASEQTILHHQKTLRRGRMIKNNGLALPEIFFLRTIFLRKIARHKLFFTLLVTTGIVLVWRGIWHGADAVPMNPLVSALFFFLIGVAILWFVDKYTDLR